MKNFEEKIKEIQAEVERLDSKTKEYFEGKFGVLLDRMLEDIRHDKLRTNKPLSSRTNRPEYQSFELNC